MPTNNSCNYVPVQYSTIVGAANGAISSIAPSATSGIPYISQGVASNPAFGTAVVAGGGTGNTTFTAYSVICAGTTATGAFQNVSGVGTAGQILTSNGASNLPTWQAVSASGAITTITGDSGGAQSPLAGNFNILGTGSITTVGTANTETVQLTGLTNHNVLIGAGTATITKVAPSATSGVPLISQGAAADPAFGTAVVAGGGTGSTSFNTYGPVVAGATSTTALASVSPSATTGIPFVSQGVAANPAFGTAVVAGGGTGATTLTGVLTGNGTSAFTASTITQYGTVVAGASNAVASIAPSATSGIPYISQGSSANPTFGTAVVAGGGTGNTTFTAYSVICAGTTATGAFQNVSGVGTSGQLLTSNGASNLPTWEDAPAAGFNWTSATVATADATPTTLATIATSSESVTTVSGIIAGAQDTYADCCGGDFIGVFKNDGGVLSQVGSTGGNVETSSTATFTFTTSGTNIILQVTGIAATYNWKASYRTITN